MHDLDDEHQQWEAIKDWWKENWRLVISTVIVVAIAMGGFRYWQNRQKADSEQASQLYEQLLKNVFSSNPSDTTLAILANRLQTDYSKTPYASNAALFQVKAAIEKGELDAAKEKLNWVIEHAKNSDLRQVARLRLARILLSQQEPDQAFGKLSKVEDAEYLPAINLVKGDIYLDKKNKEEAKAAYEEAAKAFLPVEPIGEYLQMQIDDLSNNT
jgi:predicted negative regulator of RcsB-dependent stress response